MARTVTDPENAKRSRLAMITCVRGVTISPLRMLRKMQRRQRNLKGAHEYACLAEALTAAISSIFDIDAAYSKTAPAEADADVC